MTEVGCRVQAASCQLPGAGCWVTGDKHRVRGLESPLPLREGPGEGDCNGAATQYGETRMSEKRVVIIGAVALGPKAACRLKRLDPAADVVMIDQDEYISYGGCGIPY